jgi:hypothetical protein
MKRILVPTHAFLRSTHRLERKSSAIEETIQETLRMLEEDAFDPRLKTHKLHGK